MTRRRSLAGALLAASLLTAVAPAASAAEASPKAPQATSQFDQSGSSATPQTFYWRCAYFMGWLC
ncbi:hypothetical protein SAMN05216246_106123 [Actinomyces denticolens]|uniref:Uncharacterized protein n=1 Tax=Actinomyces denticolens TaxID=52767 RepID=A0ABY1IAN0_9ACTO|nr:hypothetical protein [Actinomyces denticolens]SHI88692.1 hypothetical protein SAMN05216246_106123 [Actinomyces denticolens]